ncbi:unnamed protein product [Parnassius apollo]|uniref:(apollo) hypothetical protein n=1 Tax=Parnassius apollo TaxID=110799 RepID=A0A8S3XKT0_PARAO|nr:unnamed protein product [Parnassius apollo]
MQHVFTLVVLTLLQLCRAEIPKVLPEWYAANLINDAGYHPKLLTELFTMHATSKNPIIVTSSSTPEIGEVLISSPTSTARSTELESSPSTRDTTQRVSPLRESSSTSPPTVREQRQIVYQLSEQPIQFLSPLPSLPIPTSEKQANPQTTGQPKYFLIYQQAPVSIQQYSQSASPSVPNAQPTTQITRQLTAQETTPRAAQPTNEFRQEETPSTRISTTQTIILPSSAFTGVSGNVRRGSFISSTTPHVPLGGTWQDSSTSPGPAYSSPAISSTTPSYYPRTSSTLVPCANITFTERNPRPRLEQGENKNPAFTIRVKAPRGSITNITINPTTTTRKPSSRRSQRRKGNNYNNCVDSCRGKKEPICAAPLAVIPIDPNSLKGFPSICHLACHNSFRKNQPFEKIMDGRCSKLRTRIRTLDKNKLNREEMNKSQYTILNDSPETVVQVIQNEGSG